MASYVTDSKTPKTYANPWPQEGEPEYSETEDPAEALASAMSLLGQPAAVRRIRAVHRPFADTCPVGTSHTKWELSPYRAMRQNALRMLIATSPDMQVS